MAETTIDSLVLEISSSDGASKGLDALTASLNKLNKATANLTAVTNKLPSANKNATKSYVNMYAKLKMAKAAVTGVARTISNWIKLSSDYTETMNLFTVSMGQYAEEAYNYAQTVGDAMGIDPAEWMQTQGIFMTLTKGFGVAGDRANTMSQQLTQLGYDLSSFFNISVEDAMTKLQSGISGELEPLRRLGYDLSQAKLEAVALSLGIDKAVSSMTQAEKAELRYYAILTQVTDAQGDMARTLDDPANQLRILKAQVTQLGRALGNFFIPILNKVLPYIIASVKVLREVLDVFMDLLGITVAEVDFGDGSMTSATDDIVSNLEDGQEEAKKLKSYMMGFDELNVLNADDGSDLEELLGTGFDFELPTYDFMDGIVATQVDEIVTEMKEWLGITGEIDSWSEFFNETRLGNILKTVGLIGAGIAAWKVTQATLDAITAIKTILASPSYSIAIGVVLTLTGFAIEFTGIEDAVKNGLDGFNFAEIVGGGIIGTGGAALLGSTLATWIESAFTCSAVDLAITQAGINLGVGTVGAAGAALAAAVAAIIAGIPMYFVGIYDACVEGLDWLNGLLVGTGATLAGAGIGAIIGACGGPIGAGIGALIGLAVGLLTDGIILIVQNWDAIGKFFTETIPGWWDDFCKWVKKIPDRVKKWFGDLSKKIDKWFDDFWQPIEDYDWAGLGYDIGQWFGNAWQTAVTFVTETIPEWFKNMWESVTSAFKTFFTVTLPRFFTETLPALWNTIKTAFVTFFTTTLPNALRSIGTWFMDVGKAIWDGIVQGWNAVVNVVKDFVGGFVQGFKDALGIHSPSTVFAEIGGYLIEGLFNGMLAWIGKIGEWCKTHIVEPFNRAMDGVLEFGVKVKNTASEWWSNVKSWWSGVVGDVKEFGTNVANNAYTWWSNVKSWWSGVVGNVKEFGTNVANNASTWWSNVTMWWKAVVGNVKEFGTNVKNNATSWWSNTQTWWDAVVGKVSNFSTGVANKASEWWSNVKSWWQEASKNGVDLNINAENAWSKLKQGAQSAWEGVKSVFSSVATFFKNTFETAWTAVKNVFSTGGQIFAGIQDGIVRAFKQIVNGLITGINNVIATPFNAINGVLTTIRNVKILDAQPFKNLGSISVPRIPLLADGGVVSSGQLFVAREAGAELVGNIGGRTAVMNNDQIVESVSAGVYQAVLAALGGNNDEGGETNIVINLDGEKIYENQQKIARSRGYNMGMGAFSFG